MHPGRICEKILLKKIYEKGLTNGVHRDTIPNVDGVHRTQRREIILKGANTMSRYYLDIINTEETENARKKAAAAISGDRRRAAIKRIVAEKLKGQYITKRIEPNLLAMFPGAVRCYMSQSYDHVDLTVTYSATNYNNRETIILCQTDNRRIDAEKLIQSAEQNEREAAALEATLQHIEGLVAAYNGIAEQYAAIHSDMNKLFDEIPYADYSLERKLQGITPEKFAETIPA